jgi:hypothetical protein
MLVRKVAR